MVIQRIRDIHSMIRGSSQKLQATSLVQKLQIPIKFVEKIATPVPPSLEIGSVDPLTRIIPYPGSVL